MLVFVRFYTGWTAASSVKDLSGHVREDFCRFLALYAEEEVSSSLDKRRPVHVWKAVSFFDIGSRIVT